MKNFGRINAGLLDLVSPLSKKAIIFITYGGLAKDLVRQQTSKKNIVTS